MSRDRPSVAATTGAQPPMPLDTVIMLIAQTVVPLPGTAMMGMMLMGGAAFFIRIPCHKRRRLRQ